MDKWCYCTSSSSKMIYFATLDEIIFNILCVFRFEAVLNNVSDYYIYKNGKLKETIYGNDLYKIYIENGGVTY